MSMKFHLAYCLVSLATALLAVPAAAAMIEVAFHATVIEVRAPQFPGSVSNFGSVSVGSEISGSYRFESSRGDTYPDFADAYYDELSSPFGMDITLGAGNYGSVLHSGTPFDNYLLRTVVTDNDGWRPAPAPLPTDQYSVGAFIVDLDGRLTSAVLYFSDPTGTAFSGVGLPQTAPDLSVFTYSELQLMHPSGHPAVIAQITAIQIVPEPSTSLLLSFGLVVLASKKRTRPVSILNCNRI